MKVWRKNIVACSLCPITNFVPFRLLPLLPLHSFLLLLSSHTILKSHDRNRSRNHAVGDTNDIGRRLFPSFTGFQQLRLGSQDVCFRSVVCTYHRHGHAPSLPTTYHGFGIVEKTSCCVLNSINSLFRTYMFVEHLAPYYLYA